MLFDDIKHQVQSHLQLITVDTRGLSESKERAARFLVMQAILVTYLKEVDEDLAQFNTLKDAHYAQAISECDGKNITEKKVNVAKNDEYSKVRQSFEEIEALREWIKGHIKIFENAHILFRNLIKEQ